MSWSLAAENADLRLRVEELEKENAKLKRKIKGDEQRNDPRDKFARACAKVEKRRRRYTDPEPFTRDSMAG